ncbi:MAG: hypothetical protein NUV53_04970 [Patescibacteria group bacterium]|nr:hypothetical protein [Patescibacteria group bacterium]
MSPILKKIIAIVATLGLVYIAYYGSYLPLHKAQEYIRTMQGLDTVRTIDELERAFSVPLDLPSPIGQEELVRNTATNVASSLARGVSDPEIAQELIRFVESYFEPIVLRGRGMSFGQDLYILGSLHRIAYDQGNDPVHLDAAIRFFSQGLDLSPQRPQFLYALLDVVRLKGDGESALAIAQQINAQWPNDGRIAAFLRDLNEAIASSTPNKK